MAWLLLVLSTSSFQFLRVIFLNPAVTIDQTATAFLCCLSINTGCQKNGQCVEVNVKSSQKKRYQYVRTCVSHSGYSLFVPCVYTVLLRVKLSHTHSIMQSIKGHDKQILPSLLCRWLYSFNHDKLLTQDYWHKYWHKKKKIRNE